MAGKGKQQWLARAIAGEINCLEPQVLNYQQRKRPNFPEMMIPCGKCQQCQRVRQKRWIGKIMLEQIHWQDTHMTSPGLFMTLTYSQDALSTILSDHDLCLLERVKICSKSGLQALRQDFQKFMKRWRKRTKVPVRFISSLEFGTQKGRPHWHAIMWMENPCGSMSRSELMHSSFKALLTEVWRNGHVQLDQVRRAQIAYVAKYITKKISLPDGTWLSTPFLFSNRPGIAHFKLKQMAETLYTAQKTVKSLPRTYQINGFRYGYLQSDYAKVKSLYQELGGRIENEDPILFGADEKWVPLQKYFAEEIEEDKDVKWERVLREPSFYSGGPSNFRIGLIYAHAEARRSRKKGKGKNDG